MQRKLVRTSTGPFWVWEMPEIAKEIPELFAEAGKAKVTGKSLLGVEVGIKLKEPAKVVDWREEWGDGVSINSDTHACIAGGPSIRIGSLPKNGDRKISITIDLQLCTFNEEDNVTFDDMRDALRAFAARMKGTWFYHFK